MEASSDKDMRKRQVPAVTRAIGILRQLGKANEPIGVNQIARELELIPSTCLHILRVLVDEGLVAFDPVSKRYSIDVGILPIARSAIQKNTFANLVERRLTELSLRFGVTGVATQLSDPEHMVVVALSQAPLPFRLQVDLGSRFPALISATGRCFAAFNALSEASLKKGFARLNWEHPPTYEAWKAECDEAREKGYAVDTGTYIGGVTILAVPFFNHAGHMTHSLVAIGISEKVDAIGVDAIAQDMLNIRDEVASLLFGPQGSEGQEKAGRASRSSK
ncbi:IclR family transcriptional regulator [Roseibium sp.]|uniref:IclR family transcriptional regulator n=1 Tax=Roseibium sp. TaxID=1936156 RepID=UPI003A96E89B